MAARIRDETIIHERRVEGLLDSDGDQPALITVRPRSWTKQWFVAGERKRPSGGPRSIEYEQARGGQYLTEVPSNTGPGMLSLTTTSVYPESTYYVGGIKQRAGRSIERQYNVREGGVAAVRISLEEGGDTITITEYEFPHFPRHPRKIKITPGHNIEALCELVGDLGLDDSVVIGRDVSTFSMGEMMACIAAIAAPSDRSALGDSEKMKRELDAIPKTMEEAKRTHDMLLRQARAKRVRGMYREVMAEDAVYREVAVNPHRKSHKRPCTCAFTGTKS